MITQRELAAYSRASIQNCDRDSLVDLRDISIDHTQPVPQRVSTFFQQVHNPYLFKVDDVVVKVKYGNGKNITDTLATVFALEETSNAKAASYR